MLFFHRPYALLTAIPVGVWLAGGQARRTLGVAPDARAGGGALRGGVAGLQPARHRRPSAAGVLGRSARGPLRLRPAGELAPTDPEFSRDLLDFTPWGSLRTVGRFGVVTPLWLAGGVVTLALAVLAVARRRDDGRRWVLAATAGTVIAGHALWWGTQNRELRPHRALGLPIGWVRWVP